jgi:lysozyme
MSSKTRVSAAALVISVAGLFSISSHEGFRSKAYRDPVGIPTIGYGETKGVQMGDTITQKDALDRLKTSADEHGRGMARCIKVPISQNEYDAYLSFTYNVGVGKFCGSTLVKKLNQGDYPGACKELLKWDKAGGKVLPGLTKRRQHEYKLCLG